MVWPVLCAMLGCKSVADYLQDNCKVGMLVCKPAANPGSYNQGERPARGYLGARLSVSREGCHGGCTMVPAPGCSQADAEVAGLLHGAGERLLASHDLLRQRHPAALDLLLRGDAGAQPLEQGGLRLQAELLIRAHWACGARADTSIARRDLETVV